MTVYRPIQQPDADCTAQTPEHDTGTVLKRLSHPVQGHQSTSAVSCSGMRQSGKSEDYMVVPDSIWGEILPLIHLYKVGELDLDEMANHKDKPAEVTTGYTGVKAGPDSTWCDRRGIETEYERQCRSIDLEPMGDAS